jgi:uncharacterized protein (DUF302 family)
MKSESSRIAENRPNPIPTDPRLEGVGLHPALYILIGENTRTLFLVLVALAAASAAMISTAMIPTAMADAGLISVKSAHGVGETADRLEAVLKKKGMKVFIRINHAAGAKKAGMSLPGAQGVIFGNPKVGTPLMKCNRTVAIDLPQKALIWKDGHGQVWLTCNDPQYLDSRHQLQACAKVMQKMQGALRNFAKAATK